MSVTIRTKHQQLVLIHLVVTLSLASLVTDFANAFSYKYSGPNFVTVGGGYTTSDSVTINIQTITPLRAGDSLFTPNPTPGISFSIGDGKTLSTFTSPPTSTGIFKIDKISPIGVPEQYQIGLGILNPPNFAESISNSSGHIDHITNINFGSGFVDNSQYTQTWPLFSITAPYMYAYRGLPFISFTGIYDATDFVMIDIYSNSPLHLGNNSSNPELIFVMSDGERILNNIVNPNGFIDIFSLNPDGSPKEWNIGLSGDQYFSDHISSRYLTGFGFDETAQVNPDGTGPGGALVSSEFVSVPWPNFHTVPEPSSLVLLGVGVGGLAIVRLRKR